MAERWKLHWLEASGNLQDYQTEITRQTDAAWRILSAVMPPPRLDILVQCAPAAVIPETGTGGYAYSATLFGLTLDPTHPDLAQTLSSGSLMRTILHEVHHCLRMAGPGYGWTPGDALVSEGLAGQFVCWLLDSPPERWERAVEPQWLLDNPVRLAALNSRPYDHAAWFFGSGTCPRWYGYTLGYQLVAAWRDPLPALTPEKWLNVTAEEVIAAGLSCGLITR